MTDDDQKMPRNRLYDQAADILAGKTRIDSGYHIGELVDAIIFKLEESDRVMQSDREHEYILGRCDVLKEAIKKNRLWGR